MTAPANEAGAAMAYLPITDMDWRWEPPSLLERNPKWVLYSTSGDVMLGHLVSKDALWGFVLSSAFGGVASTYVPSDEGSEDWPISRRKAAAEKTVCAILRAAFAGE